MTAGAQIGQNMNNAGAANASGYVGAANAASSGLSGVTGALGLQQLLANQGGANNLSWELGPGTPGVSS
jgi:hypothetical protein